MQRQTQTTSSTALASGTAKSSGTAVLPEKTSPAPPSGAPSGYSTKSPSEKPTATRGDDDSPFFVDPEDESKGYIPYSEFSDLECDAERRLYLLEKGRMQGISPCNRGHRDERHGDVHYEVTHVGKDLRLVVTHGSLAYAEAAILLRHSSSHLARLNHSLEGLKYALDQEKEREDGQAKDEITAELKQRLAKTESDILFHYGEKRKAKTVPNPVATVRYFRV